VQIDIHTVAGLASLSGDKDRNSIIMAYLRDMKFTKDSTHMIKSTENDDREVGFSAKNTLAATWLLK
jgi:hypothetical protein